MKSFKSFCKNKEILVLDIGSHSVKAVVGKYDKNKVSVHNAFCVSIPQDCYADGKIINLLEVKEALKKALEINKVKAKSTISSIESTCIITREILLPAVKEEDLKGMIYYEVGQYLPIELDKYVIQHKIIEEFMEENVKKYSILVAALPREIAFSHFELLEFLDLSPVALELHSNAITKLLDVNAVINDIEAIRDKSIAVIDLGHKHINVIIIENGVYRFSRIINLGAGDMDMIIANYLNIDLKEVEIQKYAMKNLTSSLEEVVVSNEGISLNKSELSFDIFHDVIKSNLDNWIDEINRIFKYYTSRSSRNKIDSIFIYGGSTALNAIDQYMTDAFNIPTFRIDRINHVEFLENSTMDDLSIYLNAISSLIRK
ncbi:type IV pilus assembly protein PilM [Anaerovirgula multivorans]|uniref:Type IV pilus assembly protein PilM n=1 Tax=Anaerovirgula multivorans TaxID=312168 RepID=A0A238ZV09_9FIRM|nr:type IV pilus assembly protein PilM [Anaerovirgula multivorans]SNR86503.1 type IV pilus assembly protein PilM [Anaerovirgula multivorans]